MGDADGRDRPPGGDGELTCISQVGLGSRRHSMVRRAVAWACVGCSVREEGAGGGWSVEDHTTLWKGFSGRPGSSGRAARLSLGKRGARQGIALLVRPLSIAEAPSFLRAAAEDRPARGVAHVGPV